ncbi:hypothetical protein QE177_12265 [Arsenophonus sp. aPb]|uniref:hypothetical protein n=1 Tax=Arsenophonus sp. aPb TaxID=3041619 RepID=UPI00246974A3|nr:hypothetical protein [Arsenophonus sp. aPb]WGL97950.1 hypothetical protein QE177_12265 [Arsenophonus sp. aPb]
MFPEISASFTAIKESLSLLKVINDAKNDAELKAATFELQRKLHEIQMDNLRLIDLLTASKERITELEQEIQNDIDFKTSAEAYTMHTLESGTFTYINKKLLMGPRERATFAQIVMRRE